MILTTPNLLSIILLFTVATVVSVWRNPRRNLRVSIVALLRLLVVAALVLGLAKPYIETPKPAERLLALVDISASLQDDQGATLLASAETLARESGMPLYVAPFGKSAVPSSMPFEGGTYADLRQTWQKLGIGGTDLEAAVTSSSSAASTFALLLSDGYETSGNIVAQLRAHAPMRVYPISPPGAKEEEQITISQLYLPLTASVQKSVEIRATISSSVASSQNGTIEITHAGKSLITKNVTVEGSKDLVVSTQSDPSLEGLNEVTATFSWQDSNGHHTTSRTAWLSGEKRDKVIVISGTPDDDRFLSQILKSQAYQVVSTLPQQLASLHTAPQDYRVVVLNNVPRASIPESFFQALPKFVKEGGGLVTIGGNQAFGLGGYIGSAIEEILPVTMIPPYAEKKRLNVAVQLVLDKSRSMAEENRLEFAKEGAAEVVRNLKDDDFIGVIGFDDIPYIALPIAPVGDVRNIAVEKIGRLFPTRRTNLFPAMDEGRRALSRVAAGRKHMIILTDGKLPDAGPYYLELVRQMRILGITVSTVLIGDEYDEGFLKELADRGGGSFYQTSDPSNLPRIFLSDVRVSSGEQSLKENPDIPVREGPSGVLSTRVNSFPTLRGFVQNSPRDDAETELIVASQGKVYPLLASWKTGKGRSIAFTSDANGRWSSNWMRWVNINEFWSEVVESANPRVKRKSSSIAFDVKSWIEGGELLVDVVLYDDVEGQRLAGTLTTPNVNSVPLEFSLLSMGHYRAHLPGPVPGRYKASLTIGKEALPDVAWNIEGELFGERSYARPNIPLLEQVAAISGGKMNPSSQDLSREKILSTTKKDLSQRFFLAALGLLFLEIFVRELLNHGRRSRSL